MKTYGQGPYAKPIKAVEDDIQKTIKRVNELTGIKESDTGAGFFIYNANSDFIFEMKVIYSCSLEFSASNDVQNLNDNFLKNLSKKVWPIRPCGI